MNLFFFKIKYYNNNNNLLNNSKIKINLFICLIFYFDIFLLIIKKLLHYIIFNFVLINYQYKHFYSTS